MASVGEDAERSEELGGRTVLHAVTGHLVARLADSNLTDAGVRTWASQHLLTQMEIFREEGRVVRQADLDLSHNHITDAGVSLFLKAWTKSGAACPLVIKLHFNRLTDASLSMLAAFVKSYRGQVRELHLTNNDFRSQDAVLQLLESFAGLPQYPLWIRRQRRYAPAYVRLAHCGLPEPATLLERLSRKSIRTCLMLDGQCSNTRCCSMPHSEPSARPLLHLFGLMDQEGQNVENSQLQEPAQLQEGRHLVESEGSQTKAGGDAPASSGDDHVEASAASASSSKDKPRPQYLCGACGRLQPLDMFSRSQFRKAAAVDNAPHNKEDWSSKTAHLIRRCNDCVQQPCCVCGAELALTYFAKSQMMRQAGQRRCRQCAAETILCVRCGQAKPRSEFSEVEAQKRKTLARICSDCEQSNPYFERRYCLLLTLGMSRRCGARCSSATFLPALPLDIVRRIAELSEPGDEFIKVHRREFECGLCARKYSLCTNDVERHINTHMHRQRLEKLDRGLLVRISSLDVEASRFRNGLGVRGSVCSRERVEEARALVSLETVTSQGLGLEALRVAGLRPDCNWVAPRIAEAALEIQLGSWSAVPDDSSASCKEVRSAQRQWKLFGHLETTEVEGEEAAELSAIRAILMSE